MVPNAPEDARPASTRYVDPDADRFVRAVRAIRAKLVLYGCFFGLCQVCEAGLFRRGGGAPVEPSIPA